MSQLANKIAFSVVYVLVVLLFFGLGGYDLKDSVKPTMRILRQVAISPT